jgi:RNA polymerase-binding transcription factor DksA
MIPSATSHGTPDWTEVRAGLEARLDQLRNRTQRTDRDLRRAHEGAMHEQAIERENDEVLEQLSSEGRDEITAIRDALKRLEGGSYGLCVACNEPIGEARLRALPYARDCIECASQDAAP